MNDMSTLLYNAKPNRNNIISRKKVKSSAKSSRLVSLGSLGSSSKIFMFVCLYWMIIEMTLYCVENKLLNPDTFFSSCFAYHTFIVLYYLSYDLYVLYLNRIVVLTTQNESQSIHTYLYMGV